MADFWNHPVRNAIASALGIVLADILLHADRLKVYPISTLVESFAGAMSGYLTVDLIWRAISRERQANQAAQQ